MPTRESRTPGRVPGERAAGLGRLPEREVGRIAFGRIDLHAHALLQGFADVAGELAVAGEALHREVDGPADLVGQIAREEPLDHGDHLRHVFGGAREVGRRQDAEAALVLVKGGLVELGDLLGGLSLREGRGDDFVLTAVDDVLTHVPHVGDVLHRRDAVSEEGQRTSQPVGEQVGAQVPEVHRPVHRRTARVHPDLARPLGGQRDDPALERVVNAKLHRPPLPTAYVRLNAEQIS